MAPDPADPAGPAPAYYARRGRLADWWTLLHPPYTAWHLSYVVIGASLAPKVSVTVLIATLGAFFLAVGVAAHALDELHGRPLGTAIPSRALVGVAALALAGALALGAAGVGRAGVGLVAFMVVGAVLVVGYDLELFGGVLHSGAVFALGWGGFPVVTAYFAQAHDLAPAAGVAAAGAVALSAAQRALSTEARTLRRSVERVEVRVYRRDGEVEVAGRDQLLRPLERALRLTAWAVSLLAAGLAVARLT